jgi:hypothetical protein
MASRRRDRALVARDLLRGYRRRSAAEDYGLTQAARVIQPVEGED